MRFVESLTAQALLPEQYGWNTRCAVAQGADLRAGLAPLAHLGEVAAGSQKPRARRLYVPHAPRQAAEKVGLLRYARLQLVNDLDHEVACPEEKKAHALLRRGAIKPQIEPEPPAIERDRALGIGCTDDDVIQSVGRGGDRRGRHLHLRAAG